MLREATVEDEQGVLDIDRNVYMGFDYVSLHYADLFQNPNMKNYVYEKEGRVVGFASLRLVDGGQTVIYALGRIAEDLRRQGLFSHMIKLALEDFGRQANIRYVAMSSNNVNLASYGEQILKHYRPVLEREGTFIEADLRQIRTRLPSARQRQNSLRFQPLTRDDVSSMLQQHPDQLRHLFPEERVLLQASPLRIMEANTAAFLAGQLKVVASFPATTAETALTFPTPSSPQGQAFPIQLFSAGNNCSCNYGRYSVVDIFGVGTDDDVRAHLEWHLLRMAAESVEDSAAMHVMYTRRMDDVVKDMQKEFSVWVSTEFQYGKLTAFERDF